MKKLIYNNTIILFLNVNDMISLENGELKKLKENYSITYDNCIIYNYFDIKNHKNLIKDRINKLKFQNQTKINARECKILHIDNDLKNIFLNENHIQGTDRSQIYYGAFYINELIAVITFDNKKNMNGGILEGEYDLSRFSIKIGCVLTGIFNKMIKTFVNDYYPKKIISYADLNVVNKEKNIYASNKFYLDKVIQPDFKIFLKNTNELYHKFTYGNKFYKNENISNDKKNIIKENSIKVWNCGKLRYTLSFDENNKIIFGYIYLIKNKTNNKVYVGQTTRTLTKRIYEYKSNFNNDATHNQYLSNAFKKYGWDNFEFSIIDTAINIEELNKKEIDYIKQYDSNNNEFGYNMEEGGRNSIPNEETLEKMSLAHLGIVQTDEWKNNRIAKAGSEDAKKYGKIKTDEDKKYLSINSPKFWLGKERDEETKRKISETKLNNGLSNKQKDAICFKVYKIDPLTNKTIEIFESSTFASNIIHVNQSTISRWCKNYKIVNNFLWSYVNPSEFTEKELLLIKENNKTNIVKETHVRDYSVSDLTKQKLSESHIGIKQSQEWIDKRVVQVSKPVVKVNKSTNIIVETYKSLADADRLNIDGLSYEAISRKCLGLSTNNDDHIWLYEEDYNNKTFNTYKSKSCKLLSEFSYLELNNIYNEHINNNISIRQLSENYNINFSTLSTYIKNKDNISNKYLDGNKYFAICKKTNKRFEDFINKSGCLTTHIQETYPDIVLESKFLRKKIEKVTGEFWYSRYFDFVKI